MLREPLVPAEYHSSGERSRAPDFSIPILQQPPAASDDEYVRPPDAYVENILLPPGLSLAPLSSAASDANRSPAVPSLFRQLFTSSLFLYLAALSLASLAVLALAPRGACSHSLVIYVTGNGIVSALLALLTLYAACSAPVELSSLAVSSERSEQIRWVGLTLVKQLLGLVDFVFFVFGHVVFFERGNDSCATGSPALHSFVLASLVSGYVGFAVPLLTFVYLTLTYRQYIFRPRAAPRQQQRAAHSHEIAACERRRWTAKDAAEADANEAEVLCSVCYCDYLVGDALLQLPCDANHAFHEGCIQQWLSIRDTCPLCKARLKHSLRRAGRAAVTAGSSRSDSPIPERARVSPRASLNEIAPFLPGTMAASFSLTAAYQQSQLSEQKADELCPQPSPVGSLEAVAPLHGCGSRAEREWSEDERAEVRIRVDGDRRTAASSRESVVSGFLDAGATAVASARAAAVSAALLRLAALKVPAAQSTV